MPEPTPAPRPHDVPDEWIRLAQDADTAHARTRRPDGGGYTSARDDQVRRLLAAVLPAIRQAERARIAAEYRAAADAADAGDAVQLAQALWHAYGDYGSPFVVADPRRIAALAYRHLADRLTQETQ